jgi:hypothetical protein
MLHSFELSVENKKYYSLKFNKAKALGFYK